jgi:hypothetical protein
MTCKICHRPIATSDDEAHWLTLKPGAPLPEGWPSEDAEHLCWYAAHGEGCTPDENSDAVAVLQRFTVEGVGGQALLMARIAARLQAVLNAEIGVEGLPGWVYDDDGWYLRHASGSVAAWVEHGASTFEIYEAVGCVTNTRRYPCTDALDGMERAARMLGSSA